MERSSSVRGCRRRYATAASTPKPDRSVAPGDPLAFSTLFNDAGVLDTHTASIDWGDGTVEPGAVAQGAGSGSVSGSHTYSGPGTFTVQVCVTDDEGATVCDAFLVSVNDPPEPDETQQTSAQISSSDQRAGCSTSRKRTW